MTHTVLGAAVFTLCVTNPAFAYLDPGTASLILQGLIGAIGAGIVALGVYWRKFLGFFSKRKPPKPTSELIQDATDETPSENEAKN